MLTVDTIVDELVQRGLVTLRDVVRHGVEAAEVRGRNANLRVSVLGGGGGVFVKLAHPESTSRHRIEAQFYELAGRQRLLGDHLPRLVDVDAAAGVLFLEWIPHARHLRDLYAKVSERELEQLGRDVGLSLRMIREATDELAGWLDTLPRKPPWAFSVHRPSPAALRTMGPATRDLVRILQGEPATCAALEELGTLWLTDSLQHGDIKSDNLVITLSPSRVTVVDWEGAQWGDAAWDVAGSLHDALLAWLYSMPVSDGDAEAYVARAALSLRRVHLFAEGLWTSYRASLEARGLDTMAFLNRTVRFVAARLITSAYESCADAERLTKHAVATLQLAVNILAKPTEACVSLLGLSPIWPNDATSVAS